MHYQIIFRGNVSKSVPIKSNINNINLDCFSYVTNQLEPLIIGTIELYKYVYPNNILIKIFSFPKIKIKKFL